jgi:hypothetical protein
MEDAFNLEERSVDSNRQSDKDWFLNKKYRKLPVKVLKARFYRRPFFGKQGRWTEQIALFLLSENFVCRHSLKWIRYPDFACTTGERARIERRTPSSMRALPETPSGNRGNALGEVLYHNLTYKHLITDLLIY